ncbi:hypothetical protein LL626_004558 [Salmonella enterica]|nr:hypothetical protein [Salmonella enterica subsp. enterica serovar Bonariensis]EDN2206316.1 hypothetical protein [Salmonella enterica]EEA9136229.1 hypothetical protein [Salmonella enterica subsp. enterica]EHP9585177.1 hypothetical protein [Salmonella enterica subsp. houtenae serovar 50:g,z51:-]EEH9317495.1 hypothetical protein [Salmonella enterica]
MTGEILNAYSVISRSRLYAGMAGAPLPIQLHDIERFISARPVLIDRDEFDAAIFALDDAWREQWAQEQKRNSKKK